MKMKSKGKNKGKYFAVALALSLFTLPVFATPIGGNTVNVNSVTPGSTASRLGKAEDAAHASGDVGVAAMAVQSTTLSGLAGTTGDYAPLQVNSSGALYVQTVPNTTGGLSIFRSIDIDEIEKEAKATAGMLYGCNVINDTAATKLYLKIYNGTVASVTVGTTTPVITIPLPAAAVNQHFTFPAGIAFSSGITIAATTGIADSDTGAPAANAVVVNCYFK